MKPTPELHHHHDVEPPRVDAAAFRPGWLVSSRLDQLLADKRITRSQWGAAIEFRGAWATARSLRRGGASLDRTDGAPDAEDSMIARLHAEARVRHATDAIGEHATKLVIACVIEDLSWASTARLLDRDPHTIRAWTILALRSLGWVWEGAIAALPRRGPPPHPPRAKSRLRAS